MTSIPGEGSCGIFKDCTSLPKVDMSRSVINSIGSRTFDGDSSLGEVLLPPVLDKVDTYAFQNCTSLTNVVPLLPDTLANIASRVFLNCPINGELRISNPNFKTLASESNYKQFGSSHITSADFSGSGITTIQSAAFRGSPYLTKVILPEGLTSVGSYAFECANLNDVTFKSLTRLSSFTGFTGVSGYNSRFYYPISAAES